VPREELRGRIVLAPPSAANEPWARRLPDPVVALASGWMRVRQRARQRGVELPLVISDHADWDELVRTIEEVAPSELWITHGAEEGLMRQAALMGVPARALSLAGFEDDEA
jgi:putative mRNA 3-end processing factor